jgi:hypothetical protein
MKREHGMDERSSVAKFEAPAESKRDGVSSYPFVQVERAKHIENSPACSRYDLMTSSGLISGSDFDRSTSLMRSCSSSSSSF